MSIRMKYCWFNNFYVFLGHYKLCFHLVFPIVFFQLIWLVLERGEGALKWKFALVIIFAKAGSASLGVATECPDTECPGDMDKSLSDVWRRILLPNLTSATREILYLTIHNKLPSRERLFRIGLTNDSYGVSCFDNKGAVTCDREHLFCKCEKV